MERTLMKSLQGWQHSKYRKPLFLKGISQVGKTWILKEFGKRFYRNTVYINFREHEEYKQFFENTESCNAERILQNLMLATRQRMIPEKTLLILDDVQECPQALDTLEAFYEQIPKLHIVCTGTPVQKVFSLEKINVMELGPMSFTEVLKADGNEELVEYLGHIHIRTPIPELWSELLIQKLKIYFITGGMPEAVHSWIKERDVDALQGCLSKIIGIYEHSFSAYTKQKNFPKVLNIWKSVPLQLAKENKKFFYRLVKEGARAREYEEAMNWLADTQYVKRIYRSHVPGVPLSAFDDISAFRVYLPDVGLLRRLSLVPASAFTEGMRLFTEAGGALTENYILNALSEHFSMTPRYWSQNNPFHEIDFIFQWKDEVIPVEVAPASHKESRSMKRYNEKFGDKIKLQIRFSFDNLYLEKKTLNIPIFLADYTEELVEMTFEDILRK